MMRLKARLDDEFVTGSLQNKTGGPRELERTRELHLPGTLFELPPGVPLRSHGSQRLQPTLAEAVFMHETWGIYFISAAVWHPAIPTIQCQSLLS